MKGNFEPSTQLIFLLSMMVLLQITIICMAIPEHWRKYIANIFAKVKAYAKK
jgi:hypothetical protein